jgi:hypothetical protein
VVQEADVEITQSVVSQHLMLSVSTMSTWHASERSISITALELVDHVDVVETEDSTIININLGSTSRIRIGHFPLKSMRDCIRVDTLHGWQMYVGIMVVVRAIIEVVIADTVDVDMVVSSKDVKFHFWNMYRWKGRQRRNKALKCSINVAVMLELVSVVVVMETDQTADFLPRCRCGWCREFSSRCFLSCIVFSGRQ